MRTFDFSSILILYSCVLHRGHDCARSLELDFPTTTNVQVNQVKSLAAFWFAPCGQTLLQHYAVWQRPCCCCHPSQIFSNLIHILQRWRADNTASRKRKHWGFVLHSSQPNCLAAFSHCKENAKFSTFGVKKIPQHFLVGRRRSGKKKKIQPQTTKEKSTLKCQRHQQCLGQIALFLHSIFPWETRFTCCLYSSYLQYQLVTHMNFYSSVCSYMHCREDKSKELANET